MNRKILNKLIIFVIFIYASLAFAEETKLQEIKIGGKIGNHIKNMEKYIKIIKPKKKPFGYLPIETSIWKVGDGLLYITYSIGVGIITEMNYAVPLRGKKRAILKVKKFNPINGEATILISKNHIQSIENANNEN